MGFSAVSAHSAGLQGIESVNFRDEWVLSEISEALFIVERGMKFSTNFSLLDQKRENALYARGFLFFEN